MATKDGSAEIVNMEQARARFRATELNPDEFANAGAHLRAVREASGLSLEEISVRTNVKAAFLDAIEKMALQKLPSRPFAIGFVKVYGEALGLDPRPLVARFKTDAGFTAPVEVEAAKFEAAEAAADAAEYERPNLSLLAVIAVTAFIIWCAWQITRPREVTTPFSLDSAAAESAAAPAAPIVAPSPAALHGVEPEPLPDIVEARFVERVDPVYPRRCEQGAASLETVEIAFNITIAGVIAGERVAASSNSCFNDAALNAARRWRFSPRTVDGAPRPAYDQRYTFGFERPL